MSYSDTQKINTYGLLPPAEQTIAGDLLLVLNVNYLGKSGENFRYLYNNYAEWINPPFATLTDSLATAWDLSAVAEDNSFNARYFMGSPRPGTAPYISRTINLDPAPSAFQPYGNGVKFNLQGYADNNIVMNRNVRVHESKDGHSADVITKYHHTTFDIPGASIGLNIGPASIVFDGLDAGDVTMIEYGYIYGDTN